MIDTHTLIEILQKSGREIKPADSEFDKPFSELGLDSLDVFNFFSEIEAELGRHVSDEDFQHLNTLNDVLAFLNG